MIVNFSELPNVRERHHDETIVFCGGCFDLIHEGHTEGLAWRRSLGDVLVVGVSNDDRIMERKGSGRPIRKEIGRLAVVNAFRNVDYAFLMPSSSADHSPTMRVLHRLQPDIFADSVENEYRWQSALPTIESLGIHMVFDDLPKRDSTSDIIRRVSGITGT